MSLNTEVWSGPRGESFARVVDRKGAQQLKEVVEIPYHLAFQVRCTSVTYDRRRYETTHLKGYREGRSAFRAKSLRNVMKQVDGLTNGWTHLFEQALIEDARARGSEFSLEHMIAKWGKQTFRASGRSFGQIRFRS